MSKALDLSLKEDDIIRELGARDWVIVQLQKKVKVLEARIDELDPPEPEVKTDA